MALDDSKLYWKIQNCLVGCTLPVDEHKAKVGESIGYVQNVSKQNRITTVFNLKWLFV